MSANRRSPDPLKHGPHIYPGADVEYHEGIPFPESKNAFIGVAHLLNRASRGLVPGEKVVIDLQKEPFEVEATTYTALTRQDNPGGDLAVPYQNGRGPATDAGPETDCLFLAKLHNEAYPETVWILEATPLDNVSPQLLQCNRADVDDIEALFFDDDWEPADREPISRITRYTPGDPPIDGDPASAVLDDVQADHGSGPTANTPLADLDLTGPTEESTGKVPSLPNTFDVVGRCPVCTSAVVTDTARDRVVCVGCRRHCTPDQWEEHE